MFTWWSLHSSGASDDVLAALGEELRIKAEASLVCGDAVKDDDREPGQTGSDNSALSESVLRTGSE